MATHGEPLIINDPYNDERFDKEVDKRTGYRTRSMLSLPIRDADDRTVGVYQAVNKMTGSGAFSETDKEHLLLASTYTAEVLKAAQLQEEIEATQREIIFTMAEAGELRSKETGPARQARGRVLPALRREVRPVGDRDRGAEALLADARHRQDRHPRRRCC